ncbi:FCD domain-containing protein [Streptomyces sp. 5-10]|uniref:FCD domain-containing protein n=1 Tax=Streptomyces sp. 5-10 TaxID=878925 RepID=UPI0034DAF4EE
MHEPILKAVENRDAEAAQEAMRAHMERATRRLRDVRPADCDQAAIRRCSATGRSASFPSPVPPEVDRPS